MKETMERLWHDCFEEDCSTLNSEQEKALMKEAARLRESFEHEMTKEQIAVTQAYSDVLCELQIIFAKKAFLKGCEFTASFLFEAIELK